MHSVSNVRAVFEVDPEILPSCFYALAKSLLCNVFFLSRQMFVFLLFFGIFGYPTFPAKKKKALTVRQGHIKHCAKSQGLSIKNRVDIWTLVRWTVKKIRLRIVITWFQCRFDFGHEYDFILTLRDQFFEYLRETLYKHALKHLEAARSETKKKTKF